MALDGRRAQIAGAVIEILAAGGARALTHSAVDTHLGIPAGSSSYYFRTRRTLVRAAADELINRSRERFEQLTADMPHAPRPEHAAATITAYVQALCAHRQDDLRARLALMPEIDDEFREVLARAFFSHHAAVELCRTLGHRDPGAAAAGLISLLEGVTLRSTFGASPKSADLEAHILRLLSSP
ncbi:TetR/AcrR family transcriptional regulator [Brachybacterium sp. GCM10030268]|uniref:TetR/AcrR family transcriptional regulator n=1 Tax=Brachybacterium sp. GCM10030268 TaxID=3273382 RepID=UPI00360A61BB